MSPRRVASGLALVMTLAVCAGCRGADDVAGMKELQRLRSGTVDVVLLSPREALHQGRDTFTIEFRSTSDGSLMDVGGVKASANMPMPGMPMFGSIDVQPASGKGRYAAASDFSMAGTWRLAIEWDGPAGRGSVSFSTSVQ